MEQYIWVQRTTEISSLCSRSISFYYIPGNQVCQCVLFWSGLMMQGLFHVPTLHFVAKNRKLIINHNPPCLFQVCILNLKSEGTVTDSNPHLASCCELLELILQKGLQRETYTPTHTLLYSCTLSPVSKHRAHTQIWAIITPGTHCEKMHTHYRRLFIAVYR